ncbi:uncharacterized protein TNCV_563831 [Trichonephila clavipes]|nr:uncharacterized protein TNCV_563831 [Trichonephila clavipes]
MFQILLWYPWKGKKEYVPLRTADSQDSRYGMQPKARQSSRAGATNQNQNENFKDFGETLTIRRNSGERTRESVDYLNSLQQRNKWHFEKKNAKIGDMVIIKEDNLPSCQWSLGRINNIYPGMDSKWLATLTVVSLGLGSNLGEDMDVCKCIVPSRNGGTLNSRRAASPLVRLVEGEERWEAPDHPKGVLPLN